MTCQGLTLPPPREHRRQGRREDGAAPHPHHHPGARFTLTSVWAGTGLLAAEPSSFMSGAAEPPLPRIPIFTEEPFSLVHIPTRAVFGTNAGALRFSLWSTLSLYQKQRGSGTSRQDCVHGSSSTAAGLAASSYRHRRPADFPATAGSVAAVEVTPGAVLWPEETQVRCFRSEGPGPAAKAVHCSRRDEPAQHAPQGTPEPHKSRVLLGMTSIHTGGGQGGPGTGLMVKLLWPVENAEITEGTGVAADVAATEEPGLAGGGPERPG